MSKSYKIKIVHLLCVPDDVRERKSVQHIRPLGDMGVQYVAHVNPPYKDTPPREFCRRPNMVTENNPGVPGQLWAGHYGAFLAWRRAVETEFSDDLDFLMVCECDCLLLVPPDVFLKEVYEACEYMEEANVVYLSFGNKDTQDKDKSPGKYTVVSGIFKSHCILFSKNIRDYMIRCYSERPWDNDDFWKNWIFEKYRIAITNQTLAVQMGYSLVENKMDRPPDRILPLI
jgi:hypothetical protein